jgi:glyoxylase-like metal-dependent hydrolase (beta-lactamase superfamily II)
MTQVKSFEFSPFYEQTYVVYDNSGECVIIDPGCYTQDERNTLKNFIESSGLSPVRLLNTHCHLDHIFGNSFVARTWNLPLGIHRLELPVLDRFEDICRMYGIPDVEPSISPGYFIEEGSEIRFGNTCFEVLLAPGHSPGSIIYYCREEGFVIGGDVLFFESIGRSDLPGGNHEQLLSSIRKVMFALPGVTIVYPGHGPTTTIRHEMENNPFL